MNAQNRCTSAMTLSQLYEAWLPKGACIQGVKSDLLDLQLQRGPHKVWGMSTETVRVSTWEAQALTIERKQLHSISLELYMSRKRKRQFC